MSSDILHSFLIVVVVVFSTFLSRFLPFIIFRKHTPNFILSLGKVLPSAIIAMLIVYCLRETNFTQPPFGLNEIIAVAVVALTQILSRIYILSIVLGTIIYMVLVQSSLLG